jgi:hypothetical protein
MVSRGLLGKIRSLMGQMIEWQITTVKAMPQPAGAVTDGLLNSGAKQSGMGLPHSKTLRK